MRWCPSADCTNAIRVQWVDWRPVTCACTHTFCFQCGNNWHDPVKCVWLKRWLKKCDDDSETSNWIAANTKVIVITTDLLILNEIMCLYNQCYIFLGMSKM